MGELAGQVAHDGIGDRLVDGDPLGDEIAQFGHDFGNVTSEIIHDDFAAEVTLFSQPRWIAEMVQCYHRLQAPIMASLQNGAITGDCFRVKDAGFRLDTAPFQRQPVGVVAQFGGDIKIGFGVVPPVASQPATRLSLDPRRVGRLPGVPIAVGVVALDLIGRSGGAP